MRQMFENLQYPCYDNRAGADETMKISCIDIDSMIPNLALMKLSAYHKSIGDEVMLNHPSPDRVYISKVFNIPGMPENISINNFKNKYWIGGAGWDYTTKLPDHIEFIKPDYNLYNGYICQNCFKKKEFCKCRIKNRIYGDMKYSMGFTTRGCFRNCDFCIVVEKEGNIKKWQHISEFHDPEHKTVICLDNNIYALKDWFFENTDYIIENKLSFDANQGMDIRLLNEEIAERLSKIKWHGQMHFAWDNVADEQIIKKGIDILQQANINTKNNVSFYVLVGFNSTIEDDLYRCRKLKEWKSNPFVMKYNKRKDSIILNDLARWANRKMAFWACDFSEFKHNAGRSYPEYRENKETVEF